MAKYGWLNTSGEDRVIAGTSRHQIPEWIRENEGKIWNALDSHAHGEGYRNWDDMIKQNPLWDSSKIAEEGVEAIKGNDTTAFLERVTTKDTEFVYYISDLSDEKVYSTKLQYHEKSMSRLGEVNDKLRKDLVDYYGTEKVGQVEKKATDEFTDRLQNARIVENVEDLKAISRSKLGHRLGFVQEARRSGISEDQLDEIRLYVAKEKLKTRYGANWEQDVKRGRVSKKVLYSYKLDERLIARL